MLEFHKYWSNPDEESIKEYIDVSKNLNVPLFMGEGGENNCDWYTTAFPMYERLDIGWSFWSYKKMSCDNSPVSFNMPKGWQSLIDWIDGNNTLTSEEATIIFDRFLESIKNPYVNYNVFNALSRKVPVRIPAEAYDNFNVCTKRRKGAKLREQDDVTILFKSGKTGDVDYKMYGGEPQIESENLVVELVENEYLEYNFTTSNSSLEVLVSCEGNGVIECEIQEQKNSKYTKSETVNSFRFDVEPNIKMILKIKCLEGCIRVGKIRLKERIQ